MPCAACQEVRSGPAVQHICPAVHRDCIVAAAGVDEPIVIADTDIQVVAGDADILVLHTDDRTGVGVRQARGRRICIQIGGVEACARDRVVVDVVGRRASLMSWVAGSLDGILWLQMLRSRYQDGSVISDLTDCAGKRNDLNARKVELNADWYDAGTCEMAITSNASRLPLVMLLPDRDCDPRVKCAERRAGTAQLAAVRASATNGNGVQAIANTLIAGSHRPDARARHRSARSRRNHFQAMT